MSPTLDVAQGTRRSAQDDAVWPGRLTGRRNAPAFPRPCRPEVSCRLPIFATMNAMTSKNTSISLGAPFVEFASRKVASGEFGSTSEVVREAMRRFISQDAKREALERALEEGLGSGPIQPFDFDEFLREMHEGYKGAA